EFKFDSYVDKKSTIEKIRGIKYGGNSNPTKLSYALSMAQSNVYSKDSIRDGIPRILIVLNGGKSSVDDQVKPYSQAIRDLGVTIYAVAIGKNYNADQLKEMATDKDHIFTTPTLSDLGAVAQPIKDKICQDLKSSVTCGEDYMEITLQTKYFPNTDYRNLHLKSPSCKAKMTSPRTISFRTGLDGCGTTHSETDDTITFSNEVNNDQRNQSKDPSAITRDALIVLPFYCKYSRKKLLSSSFKPSKKIVHASEGQFGSFTFSMNLFKSSEYKQPYTPVDYPVALSLNTPLWIQFAVKDTKVDLVVFAESCSATPSPDPNSSTKYVFLEQGCVKDPTMAYLQDPVSGSKVQRFKIKLFRFVHITDGLMYIHCNLMVCHRNSAKSRCSLGCIKRSLPDTATVMPAIVPFITTAVPFITTAVPTKSVRRRLRRDASQYEDSSKVYDLSIGPIKAKDKVIVNTEHANGVTNLVRRAVFVRIEDMNISVVIYVLLVLICPMPYALCPMPHAPCPMPHAPCPMPHAPCPMPHAPCPMPHAPCPMPHAPCPMPHAPCPMPHAPCPMPHAPCPMPHAPCPMPHAPCPMPHAPCPMPHAPCPCPMPHAPCPMPHAPCPMPHAPCPMPHAPCPMPHAPCPMPPMPHAPCPMPHAPCPMPHAPCPMPHAPCPMPHAPCPMPHAPCPMPHAPCCKVDLGFLIDSFTSSNGGESKFNQVMHFVIGMVEKFDISQNDTRVGVVLFADTKKFEFGFDSCVDKKSTIDQIKAIKYRGATNRKIRAGYGLYFAIPELYNKGCRDGIPKILVVLIGSKSMDNVKKNSQRLRDLGVTIYAVGVGLDNADTELKEMATDPDKDHVFTPKFSDLGTFVLPIKDKICPGCKVDLGFLIDNFTSSNGGESKFKQVIHFVIGMVEKFNISKHDTRVGVALTSDAGFEQLGFGFDSYVDKKSTIDQIKAIKYPGATKSLRITTGDGLMFVKSDIFNKGCRDGIPRILVVLIGTKSKDNVKQNSQILRDLGVTIYAVGVGLDNADTELKEMATDPDKDHVFTPKFSDLGTFVLPIKDKICPEQSLKASKDASKS
ncbi:hypothetical protein QZH41_008775, partial [Actinostola sp. cb2023]